MRSGDPRFEVTRLYREIARLEAELRAASLRDPQALSEYARRLDELRRQLLTQQQILDRRSGV